MTKEDWDVLLLDVPEKEKKWFIFISCGEGVDHRDHRPDSSSAEGSNMQSSEEEGKKKEQDLPIRRVL